MATLLIVEHHANVNLTTNGSTALHAACADGHAAVATLLIVEGHTDVNVADDFGRTPLHYACRKGFAAVATLLIVEHHADVNIASNNGATPLDEARTCPTMTDDMMAVTRLLESTMDVRDVRDGRGIGVQDVPCGVGCGGRMVPSCRLL